MRDIRYGHLIPKFLRHLINRINEAFDALSGYMPHKVVYEKKRKQKQSVKEFEKNLQGGNAELWQHSQ